MNFKEQNIISDGLIKNFDDIKETIRNEYGLFNVSYETWIAPLQLYDEDKKRVRILIKNDDLTALNYVSNKYKDYFVETIAKETGIQKEVVFLLNNTDASKYENVNPVYNINYEKANLNPKYKFESFVVGSNNKLAHSASLAVAESPGQVYNPLFIYGGPGLGKTHLMHSIGHFILERNPSMKVRYVTMEEFTNELIEAIRKIKLNENDSSTSEMKEKYRTVDVLMVDDVQFLIGKGSTQEEFFNTFNALHSAGKQIIISSDKPPKELDTLDERFRSRFEWGLVADIQPPDYETRMAILRENAKNLNIEIDDNIIQYIANNIKSNIRELEGALTRIVALSKANNDDEITLEKSQIYLKDIISSNNNIKITPDIIISTVAKEFNLTVADISSTKRTKEIAYARHISMYICRKMLDIPLQKIALYFGKKDHTTIMHGINKIEEDMKNDKDLSEHINIIINKIYPQN